MENSFKDPKQAVSSMCVLCIPSIYVSQKKWALVSCLLKVKRWVRGQKGVVYINQVSVES